MIKVQYPTDLQNLKKKYIEIFNIKTMESKWKDEVKYTGFELVDLLLGDFDFLVDVFLWYKNEIITQKKKKLYEEIFDYDYYQSKIAEFFMDNKNGIDLSTCHYCNMAYINSYSKSLSYKNLLDFINNASVLEWRELFDSEKLSDIKLKELIKGRPYNNLDEFNKKKFLWKKIELYKRASLDTSYNHFDLDHLLPKSICPLLGLSLFNLVPSCQVCNEKLKGKKELATTKNDWLKISPTHPYSTFDKDVNIKLIPLDKCSTFFELQQNNDNYKIVFDTKDDMAYDKYVSTFKLTDRYNYHKKIALQILDLKERYSEEKRKEISRLLSVGGPENQFKYSEKQIEADIFKEELYKDRCFSKLRRDMIKNN